MNHEDITITPAASGCDAALDAIFGTEGDASKCWCQYFTDPNWSNDHPDANRRVLLRQVGEQTPPAGLVATRGGEPAGWVQVGPRDRFPNLESEPGPGAAPWEITCFVIAEGHRRRGVATALLRAAVEHAFDHGASSVRARPVDPQAPDAPEDELYTGILASFRAEGFAEVGTDEHGVLVELVRP